MHWCSNRVCSAINLEVRALPTCLLPLLCSAHACIRVHCRRTGHNHFCSYVYKCVCKCVCVCVCVCVCISPGCCVDLSAPSLSLPVGTWRAEWWLGAGSCWHDRTVQRDGAGDAGGQQTERPLYSPWLSLGKLCNPRLRLWLQAGRQVDLQVLHSVAPAPWYTRICDLLKKRNNIPCISMRAEGWWMAQSAV